MFPARMRKTSFKSYFTLGFYLALLTKAVQTCKITSVMKSYEVAS